MLDILLAIKDFQEIKITLKAAVINIGPPSAFTRLPFRCRSMAPGDTG